MHHLIKRLGAITLLLVLSCTQIFQGMLFVVFDASTTQETTVSRYHGAVVYAQTGPTQANELLAGNNSQGSLQDSLSKDFITTLEYVTKGVYLLLWPSLAVGGAALSNDLVYGKAFFLDRSLWKFWQMMRTFANFTLGFIFVGSILMAFFKQNEDQSRVKKLFKRIVLAGVLVNMSWWMIAAMIDVSTIGVAAMGGLPLTVMGSEVGGDVQKLRDKVRFLKPHTMFDLSPRNDALKDEVASSIVYSCGNDPETEAPPEEYYAVCVIHNGKLVEKGSENEEGTWLNFLDQMEKAWKEFSDNANVQIASNLSEGFCVYGGELIRYSPNAPINECQTYELLLEIGNSKKEADKCPILGTIATKASESTGPLYTLYGSIFMMSQIGVTSNFGNVAEVSMEMLMKSIVGVALLIPLIMLAVVLVIRVVFLWLIIAFAPILVLAYVFEFKKVEDGMDGKFGLKNVISLIFLPVFAVFGLSIALVFMSLLTNITMFEQEIGTHEQAEEQASGCKNNAATILGVMEHVSEDENENCYDFMGIQVVCFDEGDKLLGSNIVNVLNRLVVNFFGIALMWTIVMFVLKSNKITAGVAEKMGDLAKTGLMSLPVIPVGKGGMSIGGLKQFGNDVTNKIESRSRDQYSGFIKNKDAAAAHAKQVKDGVTKPIEQTIKTAPTQFFTAQAADNTNMGDYNGVTSDVVNHINSRITNDADKVSLQSNTMRDLTTNENFWKYVDSTGAQGKDFTEKYMDNWVKTQYDKPNTDWSTYLREGLIKGATMHTAQRDGRGALQRDYIAANDKLKVLLWDKNKIRKNGIKVYNLPSYGDGAGLQSGRDVEEFITMAKEMSGIHHMDQKVRDGYLKPIQSYIDAVQASGGETAPITLGADRFKLRVMKNQDALSELVYISLT